MSSSSSSLPFVVFIPTFPEALCSPGLRTVGFQAGRYVERESATAASLGFTFEEDLQSAVLGVAHPTTQAETLCLTSCRILEGRVSHSDGAGDEEV